MRKNLFCPNLNLPESKALIAKLGLNGFYREYIKNGYEIPNIDYSVINENFTHKNITNDILKGKLDEYGSGAETLKLLTVLKRSQKYVSPESNLHALLEKLVKVTDKSFPVYVANKFGGDINAPKPTTYAYVRNNATYFSKEKIENSSPGYFINVLIHETVHVFTAENFRKNPKFNKVISNLFNEAKTLSNKKDFYGFKNEFEFMAEIFSNPKFQSHIKSLDNRSVWNKIIDAIRSIFGLAPRNNQDIFNKTFLAVEMALGSNSLYSTNDHFFDEVFETMDENTHPVQSETTSVEDMILINKNVFNAIQQSEIVDNIVSLMYDKIIGAKTGEDNLNLQKIFQDVYERFESTYNDAINRGAEATDPKQKQYYEVIANRYKNVFDHFDGFYEASIRKLNSNGFKVRDKRSHTDTIIQDNQNEFDDNVTDAGDLESSEALYRKVDYSDEANFAMSSKDTASAHLKQALSLVPQYTVDSNGDITTRNERSYLGMPVYEGIDMVWGELLFMLHNVPIGQKLATLKNSDNPKHQKIADLIESNPNTKIRNEFESVFSKQYANFITIKISKPEAGIIAQGEDAYVTRRINVFNTNRNNANDILFDDWHESFINQNQFITENPETSEYEFNNKFIEAVNGLGSALNSYNEVKTLDEQIKAFENIFNNLRNFGIGVSQNTVNHWTDAARKSGRANNLTKIRRDVSTIHKSLLPKKDKSGKTIKSFDSVNPFFDNTILEGDKQSKKAASSYNIMELAKTQNMINPVVFEASFVTGDGKSKYSFSNNSYMTHQYNKLSTDAKYRDLLGATAFAKDSIYLNRLQSDPLFQNRFEVFYMDSMGNDAQAHIRNKQFKDMSDKEKEFSRVSLYMNNGVHATNKQYSAGTGMFLSLINSDKTTHPIVKVPKLNTVANAINVNIQARLNSFSELPTEGQQVGDAYLSTTNNFMYYWNGQNWKGLLNDNGYSDNYIGRSIPVFDISDNTYEEIFRKLYMSERARIDSTLKKIITLSSDDALAIRNYHNGGKLGTKFLLFPGLNQYLFDESGNLKPEASVKNHVKAYLNNMFSDLAKDQARYWRSLGLTATEVNNQAYNRNKLGHTRPMNNKEFNDFTFEYAANQFTFMFNQMQLFSGDLALHDKSNVDGAWINFFKRMAKDIAPGLDYNFSDTSFNTIVLKDFTKASKHFDHYKAVLGDIANEYGSKIDKEGNASGKLNIADAQEYTTLDEHIKVMKAGGRLDDTPAINEAIERLRQGNNTTDDIRTILPAFQPMKPVYVELVPNGEVAEVFYIKSSSIPLIPSLTRGTALDKLRLAMENHTTPEGTSRPIGRAVYESAIKLGTKGTPVELFDSEGNITLDTLPDSQVLNLPRSGFRIQMELPNHGTDGEITEGTQARKLIHNNMPNNGESIINGQEYNNKHVKNVFNELHYYNMIDGYRSVLRELGFNNNGRLTDPSKLMELLREEAISKDYSINDINSIQMVYENGEYKFKLPLALNKSSEKFQAILNSLITNRVIKQDLPGFTAVQASSAGFKLTDVNSYLENNDANSITYINPNDTELNYATVSKESGKDIMKFNSGERSINLNIDTIESEADVLANLKGELDRLEDLNKSLDVHPYKIDNKSLDALNLSPEAKLIIKNYIADRYSSVLEADIIVPSYLGDVNIKDYIVNGQLDTKRLPEELLTLIGIRIPTQGHNSMLKFKVKGFLSHNNGEMAIVPEDIVVQMGSDFDVDKLFIYRPEYTNDNGTFRKVDSKLNQVLSGQLSPRELTKAERNNAIFDMMSNKLSEGSVVNQLLMPNGFGALPEILKDIQKRTNSNIMHNFTTKAQNNIHGVNNDGKVGVAVFSLFSTFNRKVQDFDSIGFNDLNISIDGNELGKINGLFDTEGNFKSDNIMYLQSAAVDNAKEQILGVLNINDKTINVAGTMALLGMNEHYISYMLAQPIIKEVIAATSNNNDTTALESSFESLSSIISGRLESMGEALAYTGVSNDIINQTTNNFTLKELKDNFDNPSTLTNYKLLKAFDNLNKAAFKVGKVMSAVNTDSGGLGSTFASVLAKKARLDSLFSEPEVGISSYGFEEIFQNTIDPSIAALNVMENSIQLYNQVFDFYDKSVTDIIKTLNESFGVRMNEELVKNVFNSVKSYIYSDANLFDETDLAPLRNRLLYGKDNIATRFYNWASKPGNRNLIAKRIKARKSDRKGIPNTLVTVNTKATSKADDVNRVTSHFYAMLTSEDSVERNLAEDMVKYFYLTGGSFSPTSIGKYLNNDILDKYQFSSKLRNGVKGYLNNISTEKGKFLIQFFQNNPRIINMGRLSAFPGEYSKGKLFANAEMESPVVSLYDSQKSLYRLFVKQSPTVFYEIPTINEGKGITHYELNKDLTFNDVNPNYVNQITGYSQLAIAKLSQASEDLPTNADIESDVNYSITTLDEIPNNGTTMAQELFGYSPNSTAQAVINNILDNQSVPQHLKNIAEDLSKNFGDLSKVKLGYTKNSAGSMTGLNLELNTDEFGAIAETSDLTFEEIFAREFIHEMLHGVTAYYLNPINIGTLNDIQKRAVNRIKDLHRLHVQNYGQQDKLNRFMSIYNQLANSLKSGNQHNLDNSDIRFFNENKNELYGYVSADEFISEGLTNPNFRSKLQSSTLWTRLVEALRRLLGLGRSDLNVLYDSVSELMPSQRPDAMTFAKSRVSESISGNSFIESRVADVIENMSNNFERQANAFSKEYKISDGQELYPGQAEDLMNEIIRDGEYPNLLVRSIDGQARFFQRDQPTILDIRKAVVNNLGNETNFSIGEVAEEANKIKEVSLLDKFSNRYLTVVKQRRDYLRAKIKAHQNKFGNLAHMEAELKNLRATIKDLEARVKDSDSTSFSKVLELAEYKLNEIKALYDGNALNADNISDSIKYLNTITSFNRQLLLKEGSPYIEQLDNLSSRANDLSKRLVRESANIINDEIKRKLDLDIDTYKMVTRGSKDISALSSDFLDFSNVNNEYIQSLGYLIEKNQFESSQDLQDFSREFKSLIDAYETKYNVNNLDEFLQKDSKGKWTGNFLSRYSAEYFQKKKSDLKFRGENTNLILTTQNKDRWEADRRYIQENFPDQLARWDRENNLKRYKSLYAKGITSKTAINAHRYFIEQPLAKWTDPKFEEINSLDDSDPKKKLYNFMRDTLKSINSRNYKDNNYLADIKKSNSELLLEGNVKGAIGNLHQDLKEVFDNNELILTKDVDAITGDLQMVIPVRFFGGQLTAEEKTSDLARIIELTKAQDIALEKKYAAEPLLMLYQNLINNSIEISDAKRNEKDADFVEITSKPKNMSEMSLFMIQNYLYNYSRNKTADEAKYGRYVDMGSHYLRVKGMGWNPFSALGNIMQSITSNLGLAASRQFFNGTDYNFALGKALSTFTNNAENKKIEKLFDILDMQPIVTELMHDKSRILNASNPDKLNTLDPMYLTQRAEMFNQSHTMIAVLHNMKVSDSEGNTTSVYEAFDKNGNWDTKWGENPLENPDTLFKTRMKMRKIVIDVHGNYVRPMKAKTNFMKRAMLVFRTWLPQAINSRFGTFVRDEFTDIESEGRYRTVFNLLKDKQGAAALRSIWGGDTSDLTMLQIGNVRRTAAELAMIMTLWGVAAMMKHLIDWDDMDDEAKMALTYQMNMIGRAQSDLLLFMNPATFKEMTKDPVPMGSIITDAVGVVNGLQRTVMGDGFYNTGSRKGQSVLLKETMDLVPFVTQIDKNLSYANTLFSDRN